MWLQKHEADKSLDVRTSNNNSALVRHGTGEHMPMLEKADAMEEERAGSYRCSKGFSVFESPQGDMEMKKSWSAPKLRLEVCRRWLLVLWFSYYPHV